MSFFNSIPPTTQILPSASPLFMEGGEKAVLLLHGYSSYPGEMKSLADTLHKEGFTVSVPRLPGHGTNLEDFLASRARDWFRGALDAYLDLASRYTTVYIVGLSMGAVMAAIISAHFGLKKTVLLVPAFINREKSIYLTPLLKHIIKRIPRKTGYDVSRETEPDRIYWGTHIWSYNWLGPGSELLKLQRPGRRALKRLSGDVYVMTAGEDKRVPPSVADYIVKRAPHVRLERAHLKESGHVVTFGKQQEEAARIVCEWLKK